MSMSTKYPNVTVEQYKEWYGKLSALRDELVHLGCIIGNCFPKQSAVNRAAHPSCVSTALAVDKLRWALEASAPMGLYPLSRTLKVGYEAGPLQEVV